MLTTLVMSTSYILFWSHKLPLNADIVCVSVWGGEFTKEHSREKGEAKRKKSLVLSVDVTDHFDRRCLIFFEIACARPTATL